MIESGEISAGHITVLPAACRFTLYKQVDEALMHVTYDVAYIELDRLGGGACDEIIGALLKKLNGEEAPDPCGRG